MIRYSDIKAPLDYNNDWLLNYISGKLKIKPGDIKELTLLKSSVDARNKDNIVFVLTVAFSHRDEINVLARNRHNKSISSYTKKSYRIENKAFLPYRPVVVGFGPAGMFAALYLAKSGVCPIVLERGLDVDSRTKKVQQYWDSGILDEECNVQFGEGGAGTFSDGKLNTGVKDPICRTVIEELALHGAPEKILYEAKPHIGTDQLCCTVKNIRKDIISLGGEVIFGAKFTGFTEKEGKITSVSYVKDNVTQTIDTKAVILATGHSARDVFDIMLDRNIAMEHKNFSVGVRIEHTQKELDISMYGKFADHPRLPPADYKLAVHDDTGRGIYSFCMCPGGFVVASSDRNDSIVTNGMSRFARDGINANSALLVSVTENDLDKNDIMSGIRLQERIEKTAFIKGGKNHYAPCCLAGDFLERKESKEFGNIIPTYKPGTTFALPDSYLPEFVCEGLRFAIPQFGKKISCFNNPYAVLTGPETRSSSPLRIIRDNSFNSISLKGLYPCGEGAGYAGGIVTAAADGIKCAMAVLDK